MKKILILLFMMSSFFSQAQNLTQLWADIERNTQNIDTVLPKINQALDLARKEKKYPLIVKAMFYKARIEMNTKENYNLAEFIKDFQQEKQTVNSDVNEALFQIYLARLYEGYQSSYAYKIRGRTETSDAPSEDIAFWSNEDFNRIIKDSYLKALSYKPVLLKESIVNWRIIRELSPELAITELNETLTPTLFHFYSHLYIHSSVISKEEKEELLRGLLKVFIDNKQFSSYLYFKNIQISTGENYVDNLEKLVKEYPQNWYTAELYKFLAQNYHNQALQEKSKEKFVKVFKIRDLVKDNFPKSEALKELESRVNQIKDKKFQISLPELLASSTNTPMQITHTNVDKVFVKILDYNVGVEDINFSDVRAALNKNSKDSEKTYQDFLKKHKSVSNYEIPLKKFDDYLEHSSIFNFKKLNKGRYVVLFSASEKFDLENIQFLEIGVSDFAITSDNNGTIFVNNSISGEPINNAKIKIHSMRNGTVSFKKTISTNKKGEAVNNESGNFYLNLENENIFYSINSYQFRSIRNSEEKKEEYSTEFFTDRAIYRPGQTVYFKAIVKKTLNRKISVLANHSVKISLQNTNGQIVEEQTLKSNEMGSVSGQFILPSSGLTGYFSLVSSEQGYKSFQVEEYKKPEFFVNVEKPEKSYILNDSVKISGFAESFAGAKISNAKVSYVVYRESPRWWRIWQTENDKQIAFGETTTNTEGKFEFDFKALGETANVYNYRIETNITDQNGETQSGQANVTIGKTPLLVNAEISNNTNVDKLKEIHIRLQNLNQKEVEGKGKIKISSLKSPNELIINSYYTNTYEYYSKKEFKDLFGNLSYGDELNSSTWDVDKLVFESEFSGKNVSFPQAANLQAGYYKIEIEATDGKYKTENSQIVFLENTSKPYPPTELFKYTLNQDEYKIGDTVKVNFKTGADLLNLYIRAELNSNLIKDEIIELKKGEKSLSFIVEEKHLGGFYIHYKFVKFSQEQKGTIAINVPYLHKKLKVETEVVRDVIRPGDKEKWKLKISGEGLLEGLATMYDSSLDQFSPHSINYFAYNFYNNYSRGFGYQTLRNIQTTYSQYLALNHSLTYSPSGLNTFDLWSYARYNMGRGGEGMNQRMLSSAKMDAMNSAPVAEAGFAAQEDSQIAQEKFIPLEKDSDLSQVKTRGNLQETAFFYPHVFVEKDGTVNLEFDAPESLTQWKFMFLAHSKDMKTGYLEKLIKTQKDLMITPNLPRFLRENDELRISAKIDNLTEQKLTGTARLYFMDPINDQILDSAFVNLEGNKNFEVETTTEVNWSIKVPKNLSVVKYKMVAKAGEFTDGVEGILSILTNRMLVTETLPLFVKENQTKNFTFEKLKNNNSPSLESKKLSLEFTSNPVWYAVFSLPYLKEGNTQFSEQIFGKIYASSVGNKILNDNPKIKAVFDQWNKEGLTQSPLKRNQDLKNILLEETPWLKSDDNSISALFEINQMRSEVENNLRKLSEIQRESGGFPWYADGTENEFITAQIVSGFGAMKKIGVELDNKESMKKAIDFLDKQQLKHYEEQTKLKNPAYNSSFGAFYLYARSFYLNEYPLPKNLNSLHKIYLEELKKENSTFSNRVLAALVLGRYNETKSAQKIIKQLKASAVKSDEMGMYWKANTSGWGWNQVPVVNHTLAIEAFNENTKDVETIEALKIWLLKQRQTQSWSSSLSTVKAVYVLLNTGKNWISSNEGLSIKIGSEKVEINSSGFVKKTWESNEIKPELANVEMQKKSAGPAWGSLYWQYFEDLDKITKSATGIAFNKKIYKKKSVEGKEILEEITDKSPIKVGDILTVRLEIASDRDISFVHIKDMRASGLEPINVISTYKYQEGLSYYESTRDAATHFFVDKLYKGKYVFVYDLKANISGTFSNGITQIQSAFAPEFSANSKGDLILIKN